MQAIRTRFVGPTNTRQARIRATAFSGSYTMTYDHRLSSEANHCRAAELLVRKLGWIGQWRMGTLPDGARCFVCPSGWNDEMFEVLPTT